MFSIDFNRTLVLGMTLNCLHWVVISLPHPGANDVSCWHAVKRQLTHSLNQTHTWPVFCCALKAAGETRFGNAVRTSEKYCRIANQTQSQSSRGLPKTHYVSILCDVHIKFTTLCGNQLVRCRKGTVFVISFRKPTEVNSSFNLYAIAADKSITSFGWGYSLMDGSLFT